MSEDEFCTALAARIRERMRVLKISQQTVAKTLSVDQSSVSRILSGRRRVSSFEVTLLADLLKVPVMALLGERQPPLAPKGRVNSATFLRTAWATDKTADEFRAKADSLERQERGHECGHQWTISVTGISHYGIAGSPDHFDAPADIMEKPGTVTVRAHNLSDALRKAAGLGLDVWYGEEAEGED